MRASDRECRVASFGVERVGESWRRCGDHSDGATAGARAHGWLAERLGAPRCAGATAPQPKPRSEEKEERGAERCMGVSPPLPPTLTMTVIFSHRSI
eukprot:3920640-Amphidinium_carterae.1